MKKLLTLCALMAVSLALYLGVFSVVRRPLVIGEAKRQLDYKLAYAQSLPSPKIIIFAGSNGRYSHRCEDLSAALGRPCVNMSIAVGLGLDFLLDQLRPLMKSGDLIYMPLEYGQYNASDAQMHGGFHNAFLAHYQKAYLWSQSPRHIAAAYGAFDLPFLIDGGIEMGLSAKGFKRRVSTDTLTLQGDERGHTAALGLAYRDYLQRVVPEPATVPVDSYSMQVLARFLRDAQRQGVVVVGGLPTVLDSLPIDPKDVARLAQFYRASGQRWLALPNLSRYPMSCFFDATYHLVEPCQRAHSAAIGAALKAID